MIVLTLTACPQSLRGDLTKWLQEISSGVYVGRVSRRVREELWEQVCQHAKTGKATMVFPVQNEQGYDFLVHNTPWHPFDYEGLHLMMRPNPGATSIAPKDGSRRKYSRAGKRSMARHAMSRKRTYPDSYVVVDVETTGLKFGKDNIIELAAIRVEAGQEVERMSQLIACSQALSSEVRAITGISEELLSDEGVSLDAALDEFMALADGLPLVGHNIAFDVAFIEAAMDEMGYGGGLTHERLDTMAVAQDVIGLDRDLRLDELARKIGIHQGDKHRALPDCETTCLVYKRLAEMSDGLRDS